MTTVTKTIPFTLCGGGILALIVLFALTAAGSRTDKNIKLVETYWDQVWNQGNLQGVSDFYHPNAIHGENFSIEKFQKGVELQRGAFPDLRITIDEIFSKDDRVICRVTYTGTHTGRKMFKQEPLGKVISVPGMDIFTIKNGKCIEHQHVADHLDLVLQMGLTLTPTVVEKDN
jgi:predicted ester cyclase